MATALDHLALADAVYQGPQGSAPAGWTKVLQSEVIPGTQGTSSGYFGAAYKSDMTNEIVVASRGSRPDLEGVKKDWLGSDVKIASQGALGIPEVFDHATAFAKNVRAEHPNAPISYTGHSLGGACAQIQAAKVGGDAVTFGAPGVAFAASKEEAAAAAPGVTNYVLPGDPVTKSGTHIGQVASLSTSMGGVAKNVAALGAAFAIGGPLGALAAVIGMFASNHPLGNYMAALPTAPSNSGGGGPGAGRPAARLTDMHTCPMVTVLVPHVGGPISTPGSHNVFIQGLPAARVTDMCVCVGPLDSIVQGSKGVFINGLAAARVGDTTTHGGVIVAGALKVLIGDAG